MNTEKNNSSSVTFDVVSWVFAMVFLVIGALNMVLVHFVPGVFYILLFLIYLPPTSPFFKKKLGFSIPLAVKITLGLVVLWGTLAVGDLAEILGL